MQKEATFRDKLKELQDNYKGRELEEAVGVSYRQITNYLRTENPATPSNEIIQNIQEAFQKHKRGEPIRREVVSTDSNYKDKYIALLERQLRDQQDTIERLTAIETGLAEAKRNQLVMYSIQMAFQEVILPILNDGRRKGIEREIGERAVSILEKSQREGLSV